MTATTSDEAGMTRIDWAEANGVALRYELSGAGSETLVLLHEISGSMDSWSDCLPLLNRDRRVLRYDGRGFGLSEKIVGAVAIDDLVGDLFGLVEAVGIPGRVAIAGSVVGGAVALRAAARFPQRVSAVIALAPAIGVPPDVGARYHAHADRVEQIGLRPIVVAGGLANLYPAAFPRDEKRFAAIRARMLTSDPRSFAAMFRLLADLKMDEDLARITCPTLIVAGTLDQSRTPEAVAEIAKAIPNARFELLETGHAMASLTPNLVAATINRFLSAQARPTA